MSQYAYGSIKFNPDTGAVAVRRDCPNAGATVAHTWQTATVHDGGFPYPEEVVLHWLDIPAQVLNALARHGSDTVIEALAQIPAAPDEIVAEITA